MRLLLAGCWWIVWNCRRNFLSPYAKSAINYRVIHCYNCGTSYATLLRVFFYVDIKALIFAATTGTNLKKFNKLSTTVCLSKHFYVFFESIVCISMSTSCRRNLGAHESEVKARSGFLPSTITETKTKTSATNNRNASLCFSPVVSSCLLIYPKTWSTACRSVHCYLLFARAHSFLFNHLLLLLFLFCLKYVEFFFVHRKYCCIRSSRVPQSQPICRQRN